MTYWEDRLNKGQRNRVSKALTKFRRTHRGHDAQHECYEELTNAGMTSEEADEMVNITMDA